MAESDNAQDDASRMGGSPITWTRCMYMSRLYMCMLVMSLYPYTSNMTEYFEFNGVYNPGTYDAAEWPTNNDSDCFFLSICGSIVQHTRKCPN